MEEVKIKGIISGLNNSGKIISKYSDGTYKVAICVNVPTESLERI